MFGKSTKELNEKILNLIKNGKDKEAKEKLDKIKDQKKIDKVLSYNNSDIVEYCIIESKDITKTLIQKRSKQANLDHLYEAAARGNKVVAKCLIESMGKDLESADYLVSKAYDDFKPEIISLLSEAGLEINCEEGRGTLLHRAVEDYHKFPVSGKKLESGKQIFDDEYIPLIQSLIAAKIDLDLKDENGRTALDLAKSYKNTKIIPVLQNPEEHKEEYKVEHKVNDLARQSSEFAIAVERGELNNIEHFIKEKKVDVNKCLYKGNICNSLDLYVVSHQYLNKEVIKTLISAGARLDQNMEKGMACLIIDQMIQHDVKGEERALEIIKFFKDKNIDFTSVPSPKVGSMTHVVLGAKKESIPMLDIVLGEEGVDLEYAHKGKNPMYMLIENSYIYDNDYNRIVSFPKRNWRDAPIKGVNQLTKILDMKPESISIFTESFYRWRMKNINRKVVFGDGEIVTRIGPLVGEDFKKAKEAGNTKKMALYLKFKGIVNWDPKNELFDLFADFKDLTLEKLKDYIEEKVIDIRSLDKDGFNLYQKSIFANKQDFAEIFSNYGVGTNLHSAIANPMIDKEKVKALIESKADVNGKGSRTKRTPLHVAAVANSDIIPTLIENKADVNKQDGQGNTALMILAHHGYFHFVGMLIHSRANINLFNNKGETALHIAARGGKSDVVKSLLKAGADVDARLEDHQDKLFTPLYMAVDKSNLYDDKSKNEIKEDSHLKIIKLLLAAKADPTIKCEPKKLSALKADPAIECGIKKFSPLNIAEKKGNEVGGRYYRDLRDMFYRHIKEQEELARIQKTSDPSAPPLPSPFETKAQLGEIQQKHFEEGEVEFIEEGAPQEEGMPQNIQEDLQENDEEMEPGAPGQQPNENLILDNIEEGVPDKEVVNNQQV